MAKSYKINGELIQASGEKLKAVGYLMMFGILLYGFTFLVAYNSTDYYTIQTLSVITAGVSIILTISIIVNLIGSGKRLIESVQLYYEDGIHEEFYSNGKLKAKGTYKDGERDGLWELYDWDGSLDNSLSGHYENGKRIKPLDN